MSAHPTRFTLMILVDALRPDYLMHAPYLRTLAGQSATGVFREGFGFVPRQAYFGGLSTAEYGFTNMYCFDPEASPFTAAWDVSGGKRAAFADEPPGGRAFVEQRARDRMSPFEQSYFGSYQIPLACLPYFDLVEKHAPWDRRAGYKSLFHILDEHGIPWCQQMWPDTNRLPDNSDAGIVRQLLADVQPHHRLACVHLQNLDGTGHAHGPNSGALKQAMIETDRLCAEMVETLRGRFDQVNVVLFGDHGMVSVTRPLDLQPALDATGLQFGPDYVCFLDSSMARFWFYHHDAHAKIEAALDRVAGGHVLRGEELRRHGLDACDRRNGELYFLADPGVLIFPNFFQQTGDPIPGMHGYDPDCPDNLGYFLWHDASRPSLSGRDLGKVDPHLLFPILLESVGLDSTRFTRHAVPAPATASAPRRFTQHPDAAAEAAVAAHLVRIEQVVRERAGAIDAVILTGSFGRGEGGVYRDADGQYRPVNDYDVLLVSDRDLSVPLAGLGDELARELGIDFVDLNVIGNHWENLPLTIYTYDLKYGSQVLSGDSALLDRIPAFASGDLPVFEIVRLLLNRTAGLLSGLRGAWLDAAGEPSPAEQRYLTNQVAKALMALGDWYLIRWKGFDSSYTRRRERFSVLAAGAGLDPSLIDQVCRAYAFKLHPDYAEFADGLAGVRRLFPELERALCDSVAVLTGAPCKTLADAMAAYRRALSADPATVAAENRACAAHPALTRLLSPAGAAGVSLRHSIYAALPLLLQSAVGNSSDALRHTRAMLQPGFKPPVVSVFTSANWETHRDFVVKAWFAVCH
jgi:hypothetical protein